MESNFNLYKLSLIFAVIVNYFGSLEGQFTSCKLNDAQGTSGQCRHVKDCKYVVQQLHAGLQNEVLRCPESRSFVCCPIEMTLAQKKCDEWRSLLLRPEIFSQPPPTEPQCAINQRSTNVASLIVGGREAQEFEFPHAVALGYGNDKSNPQFLCGATLISDEYLLTAAHCINTQKGKPRWALIGDLTLSKPTSVYRQVVDIAESIVHPGYSVPKVYNDIAVLRLKRKLELNKYVLPACLGDPVLTPFDGNNAPVTAVGWGQLGYLESAADQLQATQLRLLKMQSCTDAYQTSLDKQRKYPDGFHKSQICAGDTISASLGKLSNDTCNGDSGGGIFVTPEIHCLYHVLGVTSFGSKTCGYSIPAVYTKVASYISWIESIAFTH